MVTIRKINVKEKKLIAQIVDIHINTFTGFFLTFMGKGFLKQLYKSYCKYKDSGVLVAFENDKPLGFLAYSGDLSGLYKYMIKTKLIPFAWYSLISFFKKPKVFMHLVRAFLKPKEAKRPEMYIELASIGVDPAVKSTGIGSLLINELKNFIDFNKFKYINLETDAVNNEGVNHFYQKNGFILARTFETSEGRVMNEYRYSKIK